MCSACKVTHCDNMNGRIMVAHGGSFVFTGNQARRLMYMCHRCVTLHAVHSITDVQKFRTQL